MKVRLLKDTRPFGRTGETAEVSPDAFEYLVSLGMAEPVKEAREQAEAPEKAEEGAAKTQQKAEPAAKPQQKTAKAAKGK